MIVAYLGNFVPEHSTENHVKQAFEHLGHTVIRVQEDRPADWERLILEMPKIDLVIWTTTTRMAAMIGHQTQWRMLAAARQAGKLTVGFHLDRWWGLERETAVWNSPFFRCDHVFTADGGHQKEFAEVGVNHHWLSPAISLNETEPGEESAKFRADIAFVGSWRGDYHSEWIHRPELIRWLKAIYPGIALWPRPNQPQIRGKELRDLYASVRVVIGDSCLAGNITRYWSDRIPETLGRGGFLLHPHVDGLDEHYIAGEHLVTWHAGDWTALRGKIDHYLGHEEERHRIAAAGQAWVIEKHTYDHRVQEILSEIS